MFWGVFPFYWYVMKVYFTMIRRIFFLHDKTSFWACFEASGLNNIFYFYAHCNILHTSSDVDEEVES